MQFSSVESVVLEALSEDDSSWSVRGNFVWLNVSYMYLNYEQWQANFTADYS